MNFQTLLLALLMTVGAASPAEAQKKEIAQAKAAVKSGNGLDEAQKSLRALLDDSIHHRNLKVWTQLYQVVKKKYEQGNEKLYLKQQYDTGAIFNTTREMFGLLFALDSVDVALHAEGKGKPSYRKKHAEEIAPLRPNLYYGGTYFVRRSDYRQAYDFFDTYLDCLCQPLFYGKDFSADSVLLRDAAYWATFCGYKIEDAEKTLRYADRASADSGKLQFTLQYIAEACRLKEDNENYLKTLLAGFERYPDYVYFFPRLIDYYTHENRLEDALAVADEALATDSASLLFLYAKSTLLLNMGRYDECVEWSDRMIAQCDTIAGPYSNAGTALVNKAIVVEQTKSARLAKAELQQLYQQARPYFENYRRLAPENKEKWGPALYRIYLNLNMGKEFEEIDNVLKK